MISPIASATAALSRTIGNAIDCDEPTARNSNFAPVNANGDVRLRSVLSFSISGSRATPSLIISCSALVAFRPDAIASITFVSMPPMNTEMIAGGASLAPSRCSLPLVPMPARSRPACLCTARSTAARKTRKRMFWCGVCPGFRRFSPSRSWLSAAIDIDQLQCLPDPLIPANGFSCSSACSPWRSATRRSVAITSWL